MIEMASWSIFTAVVVGIVMTTTIKGWGSAPSKSRVLGCLGVGVVTCVALLMILGNVGVPETSVTAGGVVLIAMAVVVMLRARQAHPGAFG